MPIFKSLVSLDQDLKTRGPDSNPRSSDSPISQVGALLIEAATLTGYVSVLFYRTAYPSCVSNLGATSL